MVPKLLEHLGIRYVSLASHSGGDVYLLNTIIRLRRFLHPRRPYVCFFAPWVHHSHTGVLNLRATDFLPAGAVATFGSIVRFVNQNVVPVTGVNGDVFKGVKDLIGFSMPAGGGGAVAPVQVQVQADGNGGRGGLGGGVARGIDLDDEDVVQELRKEIMSYVAAEDLDGVGEDAQLFLRKPREVEWCAGSTVEAEKWKDIDSAVKVLAGIVGSEGDGGRKWVVDAFHAEEDNMVGMKGRVWFDGCWEVVKGSGDGEGGGIEYRSEVVPDSDHNFLMDPGFGASGKWLGRVRDSFNEA